MTFTTRQWQAAQEILQHTLTKATYTRWLAQAELLPTLNGHLRIGVPNAKTAEWCNRRLMQPVRRAIAQATDNANIPEIIFEVSRTPAKNDASAESVSGDTTLFDFLPIWRKTGYNQLPHYVTRFWIPYLKPATFTTWNALTARDTRSVQHPKNRWTLPQEYSYRQLARHIGARSHKIISGRKEECGISRKQRLAGSPIATICTSCIHTIHQMSPGTDGDIRCRYWRSGTLEVLYNEQLLALDIRYAQENTLPFFTLSVYRVLPLLTPRQIERLPAALQREHRRWLYQNEKTLGLSVSEWESIGFPTLVPRQPGYRLKPLHGEYQFNRILAEIRSSGDVHESTDLGRNR